jgi:hypothetical protein
MIQKILGDQGIKKWWPWKLSECEHYERIFGDEQCSFGGIVRETEIIRSLLQ